MEKGHDDIFVGYKGKNYWYEIKNPNAANKKGEIFESKKKKKQKELEAEWTGHYKLKATLDEILKDMGVT